MTATFIGDPKRGLLLLMIATLFLLVCGVISDIHLGDEVVHFRLARTIYRTHQWPLYDEMNQSYGNQRFYFVDPMLWHTLLAAVFDEACYYSN